MPLESAPLSLGDLLVLAGAIGAVLGIANYYHTLFKAVETSIVKLEKQDIEYRSQLARLEEKIGDIKDWAELGINGNKEAVQHSRSRFMADHKALVRELNNLEQRVQAVQQFLARKSTYTIRANDRLNTRTDERQS